MMPSMGAILISFLSTLSLRRATTTHTPTAYIAPHFYPRSPCGERHQSRAVSHQTAQISIHALLAESDGVTVLGIQHRVGISIHALLAESDTHPIGILVRVVKISIHALLAESDSKPRDLKSRRIVFLSTLSLRRATSPLCYTVSFSADFYPRSPCGERLNQLTRPT